VDRGVGLLVGEDTAAAGQGAGGHSVRAGPIGPAEGIRLADSDAGGGVEGGALRVVAEEDGGAGGVDEAEGLLPDAPQTVGHRGIRGQPGQPLPGLLEPSQRLRPGQRHREDVLRLRPGILVSPRPRFERKL